MFFFPWRLWPQTPWNNWPPASLIHIGFPVQSSQSGRPEEDCLRCLEAEPPSEEKFEHFLGHASNAWVFAVESHAQDKASGRKADKAAVSVAAEDAFSAGQEAKGKSQDGRADKAEVSYMASRQYGI